MDRGLNQAVGAGNAAGISAPCNRRDDKTDIIPGHIFCYGQLAACPDKNAVLIPLIRNCIRIQGEGRCQFIPNDSTGWQRYGSA